MFARGDWIAAREVSVKKSRHCCARWIPTMEYSSSKGSSRIRNNDIPTGEIVKHFPSQRLLQISILGKSSRRRVFLLARSIVDVTSGMPMIREAYLSLGARDGSREWRQALPVAGCKGESSFIQLLMDSSIQLLLDGSTVVQVETVVHHHASSWTGVGSSLLIEEKFPEPVVAQRRVIMLPESEGTPANPTAMYPYLPTHTYPPAYPYTATIRPTRRGIRRHHGIAHAHSPKEVGRPVGFIDGGALEHPILPILHATGSHLSETMRLRINCLSLDEDWIKARFRVHGQGSRRSPLLSRSSSIRTGTVPLVVHLPADCIRRRAIIIVIIHNGYVDFVLHCTASKLTTNNSNLRRHSRANRPGIVRRCRSHRQRSLGIRREDSRRARIDQDEGLRELYGGPPTGRRG